MAGIEIKILDVRFIIVGSLFLFAGIIIDNTVPWIDQISLIKIESCIADMHFRHNNENQFQKCVTPDLEQIQTIQKLTALTTVFYSIGGVFVGLSFAAESKKLMKKPDVCNCGTVYRCPTHDK